MTFLPLVRHPGLHIVLLPIFPPSQDENESGFFTGDTLGGMYLGSCNRSLSFPMFLIVLDSRELHLSPGTGHTLGVSIDFIITLLPRPCLKAIAWSTVHRDSVSHYPPLRGGATRCRPSIILWLHHPCCKLVLTPCQALASVK